MIAPSHKPGLFQRIVELLIGAPFVLRSEAPVASEASETRTEVNPIESTDVMIRLVVERPEISQGTFLEERFAGETASSGTYSDIYHSYAEDKAASINGIDA